LLFFFSSRRRHTRFSRDWSSDVCSSDLTDEKNKQYWIDKIMAAYRNAKGEDRLHAIETLAKLQVGVVQDLPAGLESSFRLYSLRSEERRVGKECRSRGSRCYYNK